MHKFKFLIVSLILLFSVALRLWNLNEMGRTWDEQSYVINGYNFIEFIKKGDFNNKYFYENTDHPPLARYFYGLVSSLDVKDKTPNKNYFYLLTEPTFKFDLTYSRLVSVFFSSLAIIFVVLIGWQISALVGVVSGLILATLPFFLGLSQLVTIESLIMFFFTATIYFFILFLNTNKKRHLALSGIMLGLSMLTKYTNIMLYPLLLIIYFIYYFKSNTKKGISINKIILIFLISIFIFIFLWPMPWFHLKEVIEYNQKLRFTDAQHSIPEVFFGRLLLVPVFYYVVHFIITTPLATLLLFLLGLKVISDIYVKENKQNIKTGFLLKNVKEIGSSKISWILISIVVWFCFPFLQSFYNFRQHGIRYIIQIYAPFSIICAIGFVWIFNLFKKTWQKILLIFLGIIYLIVPLARISPYYLDYFNFLVGGPKNVYEKKMFQMGWWGQGLKEAAIYLSKNAKKGSTVGLAVVPLFSVPKMNNLIQENYNINKTYDYVMVSYFNVVREGFDDSRVKQKYKLIYSVIADGAHLVDVYELR